MRPPAGLLPVTEATGRWVLPAALSVAVHLSLGAGYLLLGNSYTPPEPPSVMAIEVVLLEDAPGADKTQPAEPMLSAARAAAPAQEQPPPRKVPPPEKPAQNAEAIRQESAPSPIPEPSPPDVEPHVTEPPEVASLERPPFQVPTPVSTPAPARDSGEIRTALYAPVPKRKPILTPPAMNPAKKTPARIPATKDPGPSAPEEQSTPPVDTPDRPTNRTGEETPSEIASTASAGAATALLIPPRYARPGRGNPLPDYPRSARRRGIEGRLLLRVTVSTGGRAEKIEVIESSGHDFLDAAAERAVQRWRFEPARRAGIPVAASIDVPVVFRLRN